MPGRVVDASVVAAMAFEEPNAREAASLVEGYDLCAPTVLHYELASVALKKARRYPSQREAIAGGLRAALNLNVRWVDVDYIATLRLALDTGLSTYDASYLYVARILSLPLVTFDGRLRRASGIA